MSVSSNDSQHFAAGFDAAALRPAPGQVVALLGGPAAGRRALLRALAGIDAEADPVPTAELGLLGVRPRFFPWLNLAENLAFGLAGTTPFAREGLIANALVRVGLGAAAEKRPGALSTAELQGLAIARLSLLRPKLLLIDEPFAGLDEQAQDRLAEPLADLCRQGRPAVAIATASVEEAVRLADRILVLPQTPGPFAYRLDNLLPRPRDPRSVGFVALRRELRRSLEKELGAAQLEAAEVAA
ncbi:ATP-binding cassette domain-containing protein [Bosea sp. (in: a-proteobacteria)]|uniref:ATP-binding cassette domain-containing protein n=1 Tax=Bosea sp. (in: a-proteobacteria) TaxID=1871050 RepID=UPI002FC9B062